jgi:hypothetical protein
MAASNNLNENLFSGVTYTRRDSDMWSDHGVSEFTAYGQPKDAGYSWMETPYARLTVDRGKLVPNYTNDTSGREGHNYDPEYGNENHGKAYPMPRYAKDQQGTLFHDDHTKIASFYADPSMKRHTLALMGMAVNEAKRTGTTLEAPSSLSVHSAPLAQRGAAAGLVTPNRYNPDMQVTNQENFRPMTRGHEKGQSPYRYDDLEMAPEEVSAAKKTVKGILRQQKPVQNAMKRNKKAAQTGEKPVQLDLGI